MATEQNVFATLACCLLAVSFALAQSNVTEGTVMASTTPGSNMTTIVTSANTTVNSTAGSNVTENTTPFTSTSNNNTTFTETTSHTQTSESTTDTTPLINTGTSSLTTTPGNNTPTFTAPTGTTQSTTGDTSTPDTTVLTTVYSSNTANTTSESEEETTQAVGLNESEKSMTIVFSVFLGLFGFGLVVFMFTRCRHKFQYLHQPLNNTSDTDAFVADDDTLVISGGLYDGHSNYDNAPRAPTDESQFRLEFLH